MHTHQSARLKSPILWCLAPAQDWNRDLMVPKCAPVNASECKLKWYADVSVAIFKIIAKSSLTYVKQEANAIWLHFKRDTQWHHPSSCLCQTWSRPFLKFIVNKLNNLCKIDRTHSAFQAFSTLFWTFFVTNKSFTSLHCDCPTHTSVKAPENGGKQVEIQCVLSQALKHHYLPLPLR